MLSIKLFPVREQQQEHVENSWLLKTSSSPFFAQHEKQNVVLELAYFQLAHNLKTMSGELNNVRTENLLEENIENIFAFNQDSNSTATRAISASFKLLLQCQAKQAQAKFSFLSPI